VLYSRIVPEPVVEIPNRPAFRASEVCEIAQIPPYVLRSWEKEFPGLGTVAKPGGPRVYRRADVEQVVRIKHLLFAEGLTLAGVRRKLEGELKPEDEPLPDLSVPDEVRDKVARIKQELRSLLDFLSSPGAVPAQTTSVGDTRRDAITTRAGETPGADLQAPDSELPLLDGVTENPNPVKGRRSARRAHRRTAGTP